MGESEAGVNLGKQMEKEKEKAAADEGDEGTIERSHSINLNTVPPVAVGARSTQENVGTHGVGVSGAKDSITGKSEQSSDADQKKLPKCERVDYESEVEGCENPSDKAALVTVVGNEGHADFRDDERAQVLSIVKKDEPADEVDDPITPVAVAVAVAAYREEKGASAEISTVRPAGSRSSSFHGVTRCAWRVCPSNLKLLNGSKWRYWHRWSGKYEAHLWDSSCRVEGRRRKGKQGTHLFLAVLAGPFYLGSYDTEEKAARAYDVAALKYWGENTRLNFPISQYEKEQEDIRDLSREECVTYLRRHVINLAHNPFVLLLREMTTTGLLFLPAGGAAAFQEGLLFIEE
nr:unnamed protein product [Digitaria exilis]CAB3504567.1 unnamed protein product [Digitaria exilis]